MTHPLHPLDARRTQGFSLLELMLALTIGLVITIATLSAYLGAASASAMTEAQSRMNEDANTALNILTQQFKMAGNNPEQTNRIDTSTPALSSSRNPVYDATTFLTSPTTFSTSSFIIRGCAATFSNISSPTAKIDDLVCTPVPGKPGSVAVSYEADVFNTVPTSTAPIMPTDCLGNGLPVITAQLPTIVGSGSAVTLVKYSVADNRYYIGTPNDAASAAVQKLSTPSLYCKGNGNNGLSVAQPLVENIEDMQFTYGAVPASTPSAAISSASVAGYLSATEMLSNADMAALPDDATRWKKVITVRICVLVRSENQVLGDLASARYRKCDDTVESFPPDRRLRRAYSTTVVLRNRRS